MQNTDSLNLTKPQKDSFDNIICTIFEVLAFSKKASPNENSKEPAWKCRYVVTVIGFLVQLAAGIHRSIMNVAILAMVNSTAIIQESKTKSESCPDLIANSTDTLERSRSEGEFLWSPETQGYILGCFFFGQFFTLMVAGRLAERFGCKWIIVGALITLSIFTILIPPFSRLNTSAVIVLQILRGLAQGLPDPCIAVLMANWSPKNERGFLFSILQTANSLGPVLVNIFTGYISETPLGWSYAFYVVGGAGLALVVYFMLFVAESPIDHPHITKAELDFILSQQESKLSRRRPKLPWRQMMTSIPLYAATFAMFGRTWKYSQFSTVHSTFLGTILHYQIGQNGLFSAIPFILGFVVSFIATLISGYVEKKKVVSVDSLRKFWILLSSVLYSSCLLGTYIAGCNRNLSVIFSILSLGLSGAGTPGYIVLSQDMSPTFSGTLHSIMATVGFLSGVILPLIVGHLTKEKQTLEQWNKVFFISIGIVMSSALVFIWFGSAKVQPWNFVEEEEKKEDKRRLKMDEKVETAQS